MKKTEHHHAAIGRVVDDTLISDEPARDLLHPGDRPEGFAPPAPVRAPTRRPRSLFMTESALRQAWEAMAAEDPDCELTPEQADAFLAQYVDQNAALEARDEFGDFVLELEAFAQAKLAEAQALKDQAERIQAGCARMRASIVRTMDMLNVSELRGHYRSLMVKRSRGSVEILDEAQIPESFWRVREDNELNDLVAIDGDVERLVGDELEPEEKAAIRRHVALILAGARQRRTMVDKNAIQAAWKEAGGDTVPVKLGIGAVLSEGATPESLQRARITRVPVVPGVCKLVTTKLEIK